MIEAIWSIIKYVAIVAWNILITFANFLIELLFR